jgi:hypothetical protein
MRQSNLSLTVKNNTASALNIELMAGMASMANNVNARTRYQYDITGESFDADEISIQVKASGPVAFETFTAPLLQNNLAGVIAALNSLGFGTWIGETSGSTVMVVIYHDQLIFGDLNISLAQSASFDINYADTDYGSLIFQLNGPGSAVIDWGADSEEVFTDADNLIIASHAYEDGIFPRTINVTFAQAQKVTQIFLNQNNTLQSFSSTVGFANCSLIMVEGNFSLIPGDIGPMPASLHSLVITEPALTDLPTLPTNLYALDVRSSSITDTAFAQLNSGLKECIFTSNSGLTTIDNLPAGLISLDVSFCAISSIVSLSPSLQILGVSSSSIVGALALPAAPSLLTINLNDSTSITSVSNIPPALRELYLHGCSALTDCPAIPNTLTILDVGNATALASIPASWPDALVSLTINGTQNLHSSLGDFSNTQLITLVAYFSKITGIGPLPSTVQSITMNSCSALTDFTPISGTSLVELFLNNCSTLANFNYATPSTLLRLRLNNCPLLITFPPSLNEGLLELYCNNTGVTDMPAFPSTLQIAYIYATQLSDMPDISACVALQDFEIGSGDNITTVDPTQFAGSLATLQIMAWSSGKLDSAGVSALLEYFDANSPSSFTFLSLQQTPAAVPDAAGLVAKDNLIARGWTVFTDV